MLSCRNGHSEITQKLVSASGVDLNCQGSGGWTAAIWAANKIPVDILGAFKATFSGKRLSDVMELFM